MNSPQTIQMQRAWQGEIALQCRARFDKTVVSAQHRGPLRVQRAFYPEADGTAHIYLLHPPGGMVEGDHMRVEVLCESGARALVTTPGAGKFYRSVNQVAQWSQTVRVENGAALEWLPQETIVFDQARARLHSRVELEENAKFIGWDVVCFGRSASREFFDRGEFDNRLTIGVENKLRVNERLRLRDPLADRTQPWLLRGATVSGTLFAYPGNDDLIGEVRASAAPDDAMTAATLLHGGIAACRYLGHDGAQAMHWLRNAWKIARRNILKKDAVSPRIWST